jgi:RNA polymerase sigma-70 factor (ECF subfamily)
MKRPPGMDIDMAGLLAHAAWLRDLARALVRGADADDLVQETWLAALRAPPDRTRPPRPWLGQVLRNRWRMDARSSARRLERERDPDAEHAASPRNDAHDVLERAEIQRRIGDLVMALEEPYRSAILLRYFEGQLAKDIARSLGVPAGTVRWRITEGLSRLRARLDQAAGGDPERSRAWLLAVGAPSGDGMGDPRGLTGAAKPVRRSGIAHGGAALFVVGGVACLIVAGATIATRAFRSHGHVDRPRASASNPTFDKKPTAKEDQTMQTKLRQAAVLFGAALPALVASAKSGGRELTRDENIAFCVHRWERMAACKEEFADYFAGKQPPERREYHRARFITKAIEAGTGPIEPRQQNCAESVDRVQPKMTTGDIEKLDSCLAKTDCKAMVECMTPSLDNAPPKPPAL